VPLVLFYEFGLSMLDWKKWNCNTPKGIFNIKYLFFFFLTYWITYNKENHEKKIFAGKFLI